MTHRKKNGNVPWSALSSQSSRRSVYHVWNMRSARSPTPTDLPIVDLRYTGRRPAIHRWKSIMRKIPPTWKSGTKAVDKSTDCLPSISAPPARRRRSGVSMFDPHRQDKGDGVIDVRRFSPLEKLEKKGQKSNKKRVVFVEPGQSRSLPASSSFSFPFTLPSFHTQRATGGISPYRQNHKMRRWTPIQLSGEMQEQLEDSCEALNRVALLKWRDIRDVRVSAKRPGTDKSELDERDQVPKKLLVSQELRKVIEEDYSTLAQRLPRLHILKDKELENLTTGRPEDFGGEVDKQGRIKEWISDVNSIEKNDMIPVIFTDGGRAQHVE